MMRLFSDSTPRNARAPRRNLRANAAAGRQPVARAAINTIEALEGRQMLATVSGNQIGVYRGPDGNPVKISVNGRGTFDFVGATLSSSGAPQLNDIPMTVFDTGGNVLSENLGGYGGLDGIAPISQVIEPDPSDTGGSADAIATDNRGRTYGVALAGSAVQIIRYNFADGGVPTPEDATLAPQMLALVRAGINPGANLGDITRIIGADFDPSTANSVDQNQLYFAANYELPSPNGTNGTTVDDVPVMFTYNVSTHAVAIVRGEFGFRNSTTKVHVADFTFVSGSRIAWFGSVQQTGQNGGGGGQNVNGLYITGSQLISDDNFRLLRVGPNSAAGVPPAPLADVASIEFIPGSNYLVAVEDNSAADDGTQNNAADDNATLARFDLTGTNTSRGVEIGSVDDPDDDPTDGPGLGDNLDDLSWNPRIEQNFFEPGKRGLLLGLDTAVNEVAGIDQRERFPNTSLFTVYGKNTSVNTSIAISDSVLGGRTTDPLNSRLFSGLMQPFSGDAGSIRSNMFDGLIGTGGGTGGIYLGIRVADDANALTVPVISIPSTDLEGSSPGITLPNSVRPGIFINSSLSDIYFAGTITGSVRVAGSVDTFYAGNVLTGDILNGQENLTGNFYVDGDIRNLIVTGGIGAPDSATTQDFQPGTDFHVSGRIQQMKTGQTFRGSADVTGSTSERSITTQLTELENVPPSTLRNSVQSLFQGELTPADLGNTGSTAVRGLINGVVNNNSFETAELLGSYRSRERDKGQQIDLVGEVDNSPLVGDTDDYYGVPLLAGQTITVQVQPLTTNLPFVTVLDPNGNVIASDLSNQNAADFRNTAFTITADKPGIYRVDVQVDPTLLTSYPYELTVDNLGEEAIGGLVSSGDVNFNSLTKGMTVKNGDLGAILASGELYGAATATFNSKNNQFGNSVQAVKGNIRSLEGSSIGFANAALSVFGDYPTFLAPKGSIGLIRANDANPDAAFVYFNQFGLNPITGRPADASTIGGSYQVVDAPGDFSAVMSANGGVGVIRVGSSNNRPIVDTPFIEINADGVGKAEMGLFDCAGDLGTFTAGGPAFAEGNGGNFRYLRVGGTAYVDKAFGSGTSNVATASDKPITVRDDSGTNVRITPVQTELTTSTATGGTGGTGSNSDPFGSGTIPDPFGSGGSTDPLNSGGGSFNDPFGTGTVASSSVVGDLQVATYGVRSGGSIIFNVYSTTGADIQTTGKRNGGGSNVADITTLRTGATGSAVTDPGTTVGTGTGTTVVTADRTIAPSKRTPLALAAGQTLDVILNGPGAVNLFEVGADDGTGGFNGTDPFAAGGITTTANYTRIINNTSGEIVNVAADSIGRLEAARIGVSAPVGGVKIEGYAPIADVRFNGALTGLTPFATARNAVRVRTAIDIISRGALGNIAATGDIQNVIANQGNKNDKSQLEGIVAPVLSLGSIRRIDIGEGLTTSGNGNVVFSGIYANNDVGLITNKNGNGDLRGDVIGGDYIEGITLGGGASIINADVLQAGDNINAGGITNTSFDAGTETSTFTEESAGSSNPLLLDGIGSVTLTGNGGIISSLFVSGDMGKISVGKDGFGIFTSSFNTAGNTKIAGVTAGGLGIRGTNISGGGFVGDITATGEGNVRRLTEFASAASPSLSKNSTDSKSGISANASTDLYLYLGATSKLSKIKGVTDDGIIEDSILQSNRAINSVKAFEIRARVNLLGSRPKDDTYPMQVNFADSIGTLSAARDINGAHVVGGTIKTISAGRDMLQTFVQSTSTVGSITAGRNVLGTARFNIIGEGSLGTFQANGNMNGVLFAANGIGSVIVKGDVSSADANGGIRSGADIDVLKIGGDIVRSGSIRADGTIAQLILDGDIDANASIRAAKFGKIKITGTQFGHLVRG